MSTLKIEHISHLDNGAPDLSIDSSGHLNIVNGNLQMGGVTMLDTNDGAPLPKAGGTLTGDLIINTPSNGNLKLQEGGSDRGYIGAGGGGLYIKNLAGDVIFRNSADEDTIRIKDDGNVGIGTSSPLKNLHVSGVGDTGLMLQSTNSNANSQIWEIQSAADSSSNANLIFRSRTDGGTGGSEAMRIDASGRVTMPYQPAFYWTKTNVQTATSANQVIVWNSSKVNTGNHFNDRRFTAPVAGVYLFQLFTLSESNTTQTDVQIKKNGSIVLARQRNASSSNHETASSSCIVSLSVNDYVEAMIGASNQSIYGDGGDGWSGFSGYLIG